MKLSIITVNYNDAIGLERTIKSVINQTFNDYEFIIIDGGSTDKSVEIIKKYEEHIDYWVSEHDSGMYDAIQKGFDKSTGEIMCWLNADDVFLYNSLFAVSKVFMNLL